MLLTIGQAVAWTAIALFASWVGLFHEPVYRRVKYGEFPRDMDMNWVAFQLGLSAIVATGLLFALYHLTDVSRTNDLLELFNRVSTSRLAELKSVKQPSSSLDTNTDDTKQLQVSETSTAVEAVCKKLYRHSASPLAEARDGYLNDHALLEQVRASALRLLRDYPKADPKYKVTWTSVRDCCEIARPQITSLVDGIHSHPNYSTQHMMHQARRTADATCRSANAAEETARLFGKGRK